MNITNNNHKNRIIIGITLCVVGWIGLLFVIALPTIISSLMVSVSMDITQGAALASYSHLLKYFLNGGELSLGQVGTLSLTAVFSIMLVLGGKMINGINHKSHVTVNTVSRMK